MVGVVAGKDELERLLEICGLRNWLEIQILDPGNSCMSWPKEDVVLFSIFVGGKEFLNLISFPPHCIAFLRMPVQVPVAP